MNTTTYRQSRLMPYFLIALILHILYLLVWIYGPLVRRHLYQMLDIPMQQQASQEESPAHEAVAALKTRKSEFGAPILFEEDPQFTQEAPQSREEQSIQEEEPEEMPEPVTALQSEQEATPSEPEEMPDSPSGTQASQETPPEEPVKEVVVAPKPKPQPQRKPQLPPRPMSPRMAGPEMKNAGPVEKQMTFADIANGFLDTIRDEGGFDFVSRDGDDSIRPSYEEMKYLSYQQKVAWHIQSSWRQYMHQVDDTAPDRANITFGILIDKEGNLKDVQIEQSTGYQPLDRLLLRTVKEAGPFPPIPDHFNTEMYTMHSTWVYYREQTPRYRGRFGA